MPELFNEPHLWKMLAGYGVIFALAFILLFLAARSND